MLGSDFFRILTDYLLHWVICGHRLLAGNLHVECNAAGWGNESDKLVDEEAHK